MIKTLSLILLCILLITGGTLFYASHKIKSKVLESLRRNSPDAEFTCSYIIPVPIINKVYCGKTHITRTNAATGEKEFAFAENIVLHMTARGKNQSGRIESSTFTVTATGVSGMVRGAEFSVAEATGTAHMRQMDRLRKNSDGIKRIFDADIENIDLTGLNLLSRKGRRLFAESIHVDAISVNADPDELKAKNHAEAADHLDALLGQKLTVTGLSSDTLKFTRKPDKIPRTTYSMRGGLQTGPDGLNVRLTTSLHKATQPPSREAPQEAPLETPVLQDDNHDEQALAEAAPSGRKRLKNAIKKAAPGLKEKLSQNITLIGDGTSVTLDLAIPWDAAHGKPSGVVNMHSPGLVEMEADLRIPALDRRGIAEWSVECLELHPPFFQQTRECLHDIGFEEVNLRLTDKGLARRYAFGLLGARMVRAAFKGGGNGAVGAGIFGGALLVGSVIYGGTDDPSFGQARLDMSDNEGLLYPFRQGVRERIEQGKIRLNLWYGKNAD